MKAIKLLFGMAAVAGALTFTSCGDDDKGGSTPSTETLSGSVGTKTLTNDRIWVIDGYTYVKSGDTVTIEPGTIIKAEDGQALDATAFIVARGGKLIANGTASQPIIFTSVNDKIKVGETKSTLTADNSSAGQWGGLVMLGKAPISADSDNYSGDAGVTPGTEGIIEGISSTVSYSRYGGSASTDNSGSLNYVSIRFTGTKLGSGNEVQGLTLGGVGSGTKIENVEIFASKDDGIEIFGGAVDVKNLLVAYQEDDGIDLDQSYDGTIDNAMVLLYNPETGEDGMEIDGPGTSGVNDGGKFTVKNVTIVQKGGARVARFKSKAQGTVENLVAKGFGNGQPFYLDGAKQITLKNSEFNLAESKAIAFGSKGGSLVKDGNKFSVTSFTKGANEDAFAWTWAKAEGKF